MRSQYRICHNCGASLTLDETRCPRCGAQYVEPIVQKPGEFEPFPPDQVNASGQTEPYEVQPQQPVVLPPQQQAPYPPQGQGYVQPTPPSPYAASGYNQQVPGQVGGPPEAPEDTTQGLNTSLVIGLVVAAVLLLLFVGGLFYVLGQRNNTSPGLTPTPGVTPTPTPTATATPGKTPTPTSVPFQVTTINLSVNPLTIAGMSCGTQLNVTYTATFNVLPK